MPGARHRGSFDRSRYAYLDQVDVAGLAWEWMRRDAAYRRLAPSSSRRGPFGCTILVPAPSGVQSRWGCLNLAAPALGADVAPLLWTRAVDRSVLKVAAIRTATRPEAAFDLSQWRDRATIVRARGCEHVLVQTAKGWLRFDVCDGTVLDGPVRLFLDVASSDAGHQTADSLRRLRDTLVNRDADCSARMPDQAHLRQIAALRTFDALADGASIRDVGIMLFGEARVRDEWLAAGDALKSTSRRLIALARHMGSGGYRSLLDPDRPVAGSVRAC
ncbi:DNA -binding domain-containing protein [Sphingobium fuliginis]|uniref:DNA -binding domain-containing protein n=1 Tax=Sphingobium fuliginis (strain ATCC 27551) TaxID=336203 RepID=UPI000C0823C2|nr:DUF2285 domain-containing protein [Sphingobium fuliginis]